MLRGGRKKSDSGRSGENKWVTEWLTEKGKGKVTGLTGNFIHDCRRVVKNLRLVKERRNEGRDMHCI